MAKSKPKITKDMIIQDVVLEFPETIEVFMEYGIHCVGCGNSMIETIEQGTLLHGLDPDEVVADLNTVLDLISKST